MICKHCKKEYEPKPIKADMVFTDAPYNVDYKGSGENTKNGIMNDKMDDDKFLLFLTDTFLQMKGNIKDKAGCYVFHSHKTATAFETALKANNFTIHTQLIWNKPSAGLGMNDYRTKHEPFYYCSLQDPIFYGDRTNTTVINAPSLDKLLEKVRKLAEEDETGGGNRLEYKACQRVRIRPSYSKAGRATSQGYGELIKERGHSARPIPRFGLNARGCGKDRQEVLRYGTRPTIRGRGGRTLATIHG